MIFNISITQQVQTTNTDVFTYTIQDNDGDTSNATLTVNSSDCDDDQPIIGNAMSTVDETNMNPNTSVTGQVVVDYGSDAPGTITGNGTFNMNGLTSHGVPAGAITAQGFGETNNRVPTADGVRELQNRRVEITYGPGSGM